MIQQTRLLIHNLHPFFTKLTHPFHTGMFLSSASQTTLGGNAMLILFVRVIILYFLVFAIIRFTGKRQLSDLQPFDLVITLLVADLASEPAADTGIPLLYGVVPILALFLVHRLMAFLSLKCPSVRRMICGTPIILHLRQYRPFPSMYLDNRPFSLLDGQKKHMKQKSSS